MARILVCGGAGFIGSHLCKYLLSKGDTVICADSMSTGCATNVQQLLSDPRFTLLKHDIIQPFVVGGELDQIYHLASRASPPNYQSEPVHTMLTNATGTDNLLKLAIEKGATLLLASTSEVYGDPIEHPQTESYWGNVNPTGIRSCYDESKRFAEALCMAYHRKHSAKVRIARIFNTYGPHMQKNDGRVVTNLINQALEGKELTVYGDGSQTRSFCYVEDLVHGLHALMNGPVMGPVNLGNPTEMTVLELAHTIKKLTKTKAEIVFHPLPADDPIKRKPDITLAQSALGWQPKVPLDIGLKKTIEYFSKGCV